MDFDTLMKQWPWRPIRNCPGRFALAHDDHTLRLEALVGPERQADEFSVAGARDAVLVLPIANGGLISYRRADGTFMHTLNTPEGFERKLAQLGIRLRQPPTGRS
jgi:hypothetical protein